MYINKYHLFIFIHIACLPKLIFSTSSLNKLLFNAFLLKCKFYFVYFISFHFTYYHFSKRINTDLFLCKNMTFFPTRSTKSE